MLHDKNVLHILYELVSSMQMGQETKDTCIFTQTSHSDSVTIPVTSLDPQFLCKLQNKYGSDQKF